MKLNKFKIRPEQGWPSPDLKSILYDEMLVKSRKNALSDATSSHIRSIWSLSRNQFPLTKDNHVDQISIIEHCIETYLNNMTDKISREWDVKAKQRQEKYDEWFERIDNAIELEEKNRTDPFSFLCGKMRICARRLPIIWKLFKE